MPHQLEHAGRTLTVDDDWTIEADSWIPGRLHRCDLKQGDLAVPFDPPEGTRAARVARLRDTHPRVWAARHVLGGVAQVLVAVFGISLVVRGLLPHVDIPLPDVDLPDIPFPDLFGWVPDIRIPRPDPARPAHEVLAARRDRDRRRRAQEAKRQADEAARDGD